MKKSTITGIIALLSATFLYVVPAQSQSSVEDLMSSGNSLLQSGSYTEAAGVFRKVLSMEPRNFEAQANLAFSYLQSDRYDKAVAEYNKALGMSPRNADCWANLGFAYERLGKTGKAADAIAKSIELNPNNIDGRMNLAAMLENQNSWDKALSHYQEIIRMDGKKSEAYCGVARCYMAKNNIPGAKKALTEAFAANETDGEPHWQMGNILWRKENNQADALKEYQLAVKLDQNSQVFYENLALLYEDLGKKDEAMATWKTFLIYADEAIKKDDIKRHIERLEKGETSSGAPKVDAKASREQASENDAARMQQLQSELRKDKAPDAKRIDTKPIDVGNDMDNLSQDTSHAVNFREEAKKKAAAKKDNQ